MELSKFNGLNGLRVKIILLELLEVGLFRPVRDAKELTLAPHCRHRLRKVQIRLDIEQKRLARLEPAQLFQQLDRYLGSPPYRELNEDLHLLGLPTFPSLLRHMIDQERDRPVVRM